MSYGFLETAITPSVKAYQQKMGADGLWKEFKGNREFDQFTEAESNFIADRDSIYIATVSETGWPYVQHRGGPRGFLKVVDSRTIAFADYRGNRQYISAGNVIANNRACIFMMDYTRRARLKVFVHVDIVELESDPALAQLVTVQDYNAKVERVIKLKLENFDWNCPQHITPRFSEREVQESLEPIYRKMKELELVNADLRAQLARLKT